MPIGSVYRMDIDTGISYVSWPEDTPVLWATKEEHSEEPFFPDWTEEREETGTPEAQVGSSSGSGAHPATKEEVKEEKEEVKEEDTGGSGSGTHPAAKERKAGDNNRPWILKDAETQPGIEEKTHPRTVPLPAAATFISEENGELHETDVIYAGHGLYKMVYKVQTTSTSSCLFPGRVLKLTPQHDPEPDIIRQLPSEVVPQLHAVKKLRFVIRERGKWHKRDLANSTWHAWIVDWMMPCDFAVKNNEESFATVVEHFAFLKRLCIYPYQPI